MAKTKEHNKARNLRSKGVSIKEIARELSVSQSSASRWCRDIILTLLQIKKLEEKKLKGGYIGRLKGAQIQKERKERITRELKKEGENKLGKLSSRDFFIAGIALYWGEGSKDGRLQITNSDPEIIKFFIYWVQKTFNINKNYFVFYITVNIIHKKRVKEIERYWLNILNISHSQLGKTVLILSKNKKRYSNFKVHYGTLRATVRKSYKLRHITQGLIEGLIQNLKNETLPG